MKPWLLAQRVVDPDLGILILASTQICQPDGEFELIAQWIERTEPDCAIASFDCSGCMSSTAKGLADGFDPPSVCRIRIEHKSTIQRGERGRLIPHHGQEVRRHPESIGVIGPKLDRQLCVADAVFVLWPGWEDPALSSLYGAAPSHQSRRSRVGGIKLQCHFG